MDTIQDLKRLAGIGQADRINVSGVMSPVGSNISLTGMEKRELERKHNIKPGTPEWFRLWFSRPYLTGETPVDIKSKQH